MSDQFVQRKSGVVRSLLRIGMNMSSCHFPKSSTIRQTQLDRLALAVWSNKYIAQRILTTGSFAKEDIVRLGKSVGRGDTCFDVGDNIGIYYIFLARLVSVDGRVVAFKPVRRNALLTELNCEQNGFRNVSVQEVTLSDRSGKSLTSHLLEGDSAYSCSSDDGTAGNTGDSLTLNDLCTQSGLSSVAFIKIDVEGAEFTVRKWASQLLSSLGRPRAIMAGLVDEYLAGFKPTVADLCAWMEVGCYASHAVRNGRLTPVSAAETNMEIVFLVTGCPSSQ